MRDAMVSGVFGFIGGIGLWFLVIVPIGRKLSGNRHWPFGCVLLALLALAGCGAARGVDVIEAPLAEQSVIPPLPADLAVPCDDPGVSVGQDARLALADNRAALKVCIDRHGQTVQFYEDVRAVSKLAIAAGGPGR